MFSCSFNRAILNGKIKCRLAVSNHVAERHNINCSSSQDSEICKKTLDKYYTQLMFSLKSSSPMASLPNSKKSKLHNQFVL